jgi:hypothetical protein
MFFTILSYQSSSQRSDHCALIRNWCWAHDSYLPPAEHLIRLFSCSHGLSERNS